MLPFFSIPPCIMTLILKVIGVLIHDRLGWPLIKSNLTCFILERPGIEGFQIIGDAIPGGRLLGCGYTVRGTSLCIFQVKLLFISSFLDNFLPIIYCSCFVDYLCVNIVFTISGFVIFTMAPDSTLKVSIEMKLDFFSVSAG